ncbi:MAG TPA: hypothetical protein PLY87_07040, partial [Planctomycetaceae bacterium]|nr:hypothetical protein [Planctomycetaceae bacterium]
FGSDVPFSEPFEVTFTSISSPAVDHSEGTQIKLPITWLSDKEQHRTLIVEFYLAFFEERVLAANSEEGSAIDDQILEQERAEIRKAFADLSFLPISQTQTGPDGLDSATLPVDGPKPLQFQLTDTGVSFEGDERQDPAVWTSAEIKIPQIANRATGSVGSLFYFFSQLGLIGGIASIFSFPLIVRSVIEIGSVFAKRRITWLAGLPLVACLTAAVGAFGGTLVIAIATVTQGTPAGFATVFLTCETVLGLFFGVLTFIMNRLPDNPPSLKVKS